MIVLVYGVGGRDVYVDLYARVVGLLDGVRQGLNVRGVDTISDRACGFDEYLYYNETGNSAARLFYQEFAEQSTQAMER